VDIHIMTNPSVGQWTFFDTEVTDATGRVSYHVPDNRRLSEGMYPVKMVVRWGWFHEKLLLPRQCDSYVI